MLRVHEGNVSFACGYFNGNDVVDVFRYLSHFGLTHVEIQQWFDHQFILIGLDPGRINIITLFIDSLCQSATLSSKHLRKHNGTTSSNHTAMLTKQRIEPHLQSQLQALRDSKEHTNMCDAESFTGHVSHMLEYRCAEQKLDPALRSFSSVAYANHAFRNVCINNKAHKQLIQELLNITHDCDTHVSSGIRRDNNADDEKSNVDGDNRVSVVSSSSSKSKTPVFVIGDAKFSGNSHQHIIKSLEQVATVVVIQEGLTSMMCHNCQSFDTPMAK